MRCKMCCEILNFVAPNYALFEFFKLFIPIILALMLGRMWDYYFLGRKEIFCSIIWSETENCLKIHLVNSGKITIHITFMELYDSKWRKHNSITVVKRIRHYICLRAKKSTKMCG